MLSKNYLFRNLQKDQIELLASLTEEEKAYPKGSIVFKQGGTDGSLFVIKEGSIRLSKTAADDKEKGTLTPRESVDFLRLGVGDCFGELALITGLPRSATAIAAEDSVLLELKRENFNYILNQYQNIRYHIMSLVEMRLLETQRVNDEIAKRTVSPFVRLGKSSDTLSGSNIATPPPKESPRAEKPHPK